MPELPEVETIVRELSSLKIVGCHILKALVFCPSTIGNSSIEKFREGLEGEKIKGIARHGKWLKFTLSKAQLFVHLRMTGKFFFRGQEDKPHPHERVRLILDDGRCLCFEDQRKFGRWELVYNQEAGPIVGIDPTTPKFTYNAFKSLLMGHSQIIKSFLLNQKYLSGLGNIYVDESLWEAHIHPLRQTDKLTEDEMEALFEVIPLVLQKGIDNTGTTLGNTEANYYSVSGRRGDNQHRLNVFRRDGLSCPRCGTTIVRSVVAQRGTHTCPTCQKMP